MMHFCINRHDAGTVSHLFLDWLVRKMGQKECGLSKAVGKKMTEELALLKEVRYYTIVDTEELSDVHGKSQILADNAARRQRRKRDVKPARPLLWSCQPSFPRSQR
jgi:hypothetical protein